jgi:hypothetical protein
MAMALQEPSGMWIQQQKLFTFDGMAAKEAFNAKRVTGFIPLAGLGVHAALQTAEGGDGGPPIERTELWSDGSATLISLVGDQPGPRRGVSSTFTTESGSSANLMGWSFDDRTGIPQFKAAAAFCLGASCSSVALPNQQADVPSVFPELASNRVMGSMTDRYVVQAFEVIIADPMQPTMAATVFAAGASQFSIRSADLSSSTSKEINPPLFIVDVASGPIGLPPGDVIGPSSIAVTGDGQILIAWVVHQTMPGGQRVAILKARRYTIRTCP